jgi:hypothetical protein
MSIPRVQVRRGRRIRADLWRVLMGFGGFRGTEAIAECAEERLLRGFGRVPICVLDEMYPTVWMMCSTDGVDSNRWNVIDGYRDLLVKIKTRVIARFWNKRGKLWAFIQLFAWLKLVYDSWGV